MPATHALPTRLQIRSANAIARNLARMSVDGRREDAMRFFALASAMMDAAVDAGVSNEWLADMAKGLHDQLSNLDGRMRSDLDDAGCINDWRPIDLSDLDAVIGRLA